MTKVSGAGALLWSSYLGGSEYEEGGGVAADGSGNAILIGGTQSNDFPIAGAFQPSRAGGEDAYVTKVSGAGALLWSSYLGGSSYDVGREIAADGSGNTFVTGVTYSSDFPSGGGSKALIGYGTETFFAKLQPATGTAGASCSNAGACLSGFCVDGVCCDKACTAGCEACTAAKKGTGADGTCGPIADGLDPDSECAPPSCAAGTVTKGQVCNGAGACRDDGTIACAPYLCAGTACATSCAIDGDCVPSAFCSGTTCTPDLDLGAACGRTSQCKSGFCVDGVCCDKACAGGCEACTTAKKGSGVDGTCANVAADTNPKGACSVGTGTCPAEGICDGAGACRSFARAGTPCGETTCSGGMVVGKICTGDSATCADSAGATCAPYVCGTAACKTTCATDEDCTAETFCSTTGACVPKAANGAACTTTHECNSGLCADHVCCDRACNGTCEACNEPGSVGTCIPVAGEPRDTRPSCDALAADDCAKKTCDGKVRDACAGYVNGPTTQCGAATCTGDRRFQAKGSCDGAGACAQPAPIACGTYACDTTSPTGCKSTCNADSDCASGFVCDPDTKTCATPQPSPAPTAVEGSGCSCETEPHQRPWSVAPIVLLLFSALRRRTRCGST